jgi:hypothetical protein
MILNLYCDTSLSVFARPLSLISIKTRQPKPNKTAKAQTARKYMILNLYCDT